ncbi:hypothetical protein AAFF_G00036510 [Aldrovandia affinis]|uniref:Uncharacterized protein n=1 Tax=Aldrovandia affinis TaxID=143900 RepID=A0AAD7S3F8_9TELE|nr:hypothetical protein AAFF_G00036510 [Aldrovandia affinis]
MFSKPILTQLPCVASFSPEPQQTNQANAAGAAGGRVPGRERHCPAQDGALPWGRRSGHSPGLKLTDTSEACERPDAIPPALMVLSERSDCACPLDPAAARCGQREGGGRGARMCGPAPRRAGAPQRPHYNQLSPNEQDLDL